MHNNCGNYAAPGYDGKITGTAACKWNRPGIDAVCLPDPSKPCQCIANKGPDSSRYKCDDQKAGYCASKPFINGKEVDISKELGCAGSRSVQCAVSGPNKNYCECDGTGWK